MNTVLWVVLPYLSAAVFAVGTVAGRRGRRRWTVRSGHRPGPAVLRWGSPVFHAAWAGVVLGHLVGLLVPARVTAAAGLDAAAYGRAASWLGVAAGTAAVLGLAVMVLHRRRTGSPTAPPDRRDAATHLLLAAVLLLGLYVTARGQGGGDAYRETAGPWVRSLLVLRPDPALAAEMPPVLRAHVLAAFALLAAWPFTRLAHAFLLPVGYLARPYVLYRAHPRRRPRRAAPAAAGRPVP
ncbi:nitrate reductase subunit gamma [Pilimelia terevasa]|uniref:Nitrate reductase subunit gamma n=1 Tax=Pilimelia terevasa TaxID=53372 RepID=A0A8J3FG39_9ACTN|nr:respiratory nitrate reductase subunit gamma [Pilimelia terevasa]GGK23521.1 nitrate reductase subunit gamma [Pilimelia terevasa]